MSDGDNVAAAAELFKTLGNESRLRLLILVGEAPRTVGELVTATSMSQPLVSQHLRTLKVAGLVTAHRHGREVEYRVADEHVAHVIGDAVTHAAEETSSQPATGA